MKIDRNNYEVYFLDYLEGRLTTDERAALLLFVSENPDLKELLEGEAFINLTPDETVSFSPKSALKKKTAEVTATVPDPGTSQDHIITTSADGINPGNYEEFMVRFYENELSEAEKADLSVFLKESPTYIKEFELFGNTILEPDMGVIYPHKNSLKRKLLVPLQTKRIFSMVAVAASVLLFSTLFLKYINSPNLKEQNKQLAGSYAGKVETARQASAKTNFATINPTEINPTEKSNLAGNSVKGKDISSATASVIRSGFKSGAQNRITATGPRTSLEVPTPLFAKQLPLLASAQFTAPKTINRRTDFDGITSVAYYDSDPDASPLKAEGRTIGGRLGYTLASGISQTAGTIARKPELGRLLQGKVSLADIAGLGLAGFDVITDSKLYIVRKYDADGNLKGYSIVDGNKKLKQ
jgi:hypothetical protein